MSDTDSIVLPLTRHTKSCYLGPNSVWNKCLCLLIDEADRPCDVCACLSVSAKRCKACRLISRGRHAYVCAVLEVSS